MREWGSLIKIQEKLRSRWRNLQNTFGNDLSIERIALDRVRYAAMCEGVERFFRDIDGYVQGTNEYEDKEEIQERIEEKDLRRKQ
jgi:hypothetical protein